MSVNKFIPEVWSARLQESLHKNLVFGALCNRSWEGDIVEYGDTVHITNLADITVKAYTPGVDIDDPEQLSGTDNTLVIDHGVYYNFFLNDVNAAQARADLMDGAMRNAAIQLAEDTEQYILSVIQGDNRVPKSSGAIPSGGVYELILSIKTAMDQRNVPRVGRKLVMPPAVEAELYRDARFVTGNSTLAESLLAEGALARALGFDIYISNDLTNEIIALTEDGVTFAQQILRMEAYRREKGFDDGVKGLSLCGAKVLQPNCIYRYTITA